jgi:UDP-N-acetylmuramoyl-tripeptide--D-alanyl-D-alanine ligase
MMQLSQAANMLDAKLVGKDVLFTAVSKDTRTIHQGDLYIALKGERFDGHDFINDAATAGAVAAMVDENQNSTLPHIKVADTRLALGALAAGWRRQFTGKVAGITGSNGKTTVKEMCRSMLVQHAGDERVLSTQGNLNNDIGLPLTLLALREQHQFAVIEMGANHVGEIDYLTHIAQPDVALVNNVAPAHIEGFGSLENIAHAKAEIYSGLSAKGTAVINLDDHFAPLWLDICKQRTCRTFSLENTDANVYAGELQMDATGSRFVLHVDGASEKTTLALPGRHNVMNALAATAVCSSLGVKIKTIVAALKNFNPVNGRLNIKSAINGARMIDDTYNANPQSFNAAMQVLTTMPGSAWMVMGDMAELGSDAKELHRALGAEAKQMGVQRLFATGELSREAVRGFGTNAEWFAKQSSLIDVIKSELKPENIVLVKGSRFMAMEKVVSALLPVSKQGKNKSNGSGNRREVS